MATNSGLKVYAGGSYKDVKDYWVYANGGWKQGKSIWVYANGAWRQQKNPELVKTNWSFSPLKSDTVAYPGAPWNNDDFRIGNYGGTNYQGFAFGSLGIGSVSQVTYVRLRITRNTGSGGDNGGSVIFKHCTYTNTSAPPSAIPTSLSSESCSMTVPARGASSTKTFTSDSELAFWKKWVNSSGCLTSYMPGNSSIYSGYTSIVIEEIRYIK